MNQEAYITASTHSVEYYAPNGIMKECCWWSQCLKQDKSALKLKKRQDLIH